MTLITPLEVDNDIARKQMRTRSLLVGIANDMYKKLALSYIEGARIIWQNDDGLNPQQAIDSLGNDAVAFLTLATQVAALVNNASPGTINFSAPMSTTLNEDGTVVFGPL